MRFRGRRVVPLLMAALCAAGLYAGERHSKPAAEKKTVHVRQYTRKDGTVVSEHERTVPGTKAQVQPRRTRVKSTTGNTPYIQRDSRGHIKRSETAKHNFERSHPCPATGKTTGSCPGYVVDHVKPLACGGADAPENMQWQTAQAAKAKDRWERTGCTPVK